ncbi:hypothetical protein [Calothrix rhizosoleniae]|uniref:hypothetical protein n=1 Tax=Calothrix rhizosoleniae TaxID=888997 RepID=UPI000B49B16E|nr:hypothetical protein [Calothrix rhizosoleniae]
MNGKKLTKTTRAIAKYTLAILTFTSFIIPPSSVQAETIYPKSLHIAQTATQQKLPQPPKIKLTDEQIAKIKKILEKRKVDMEGVLTDTQKQKIKAAIDAGQPPRQVYASIKLSNDQQLRLQQIYIASEKDKEDVLTESQKQQVNEYRKKVRQHRQKLQQQQKK